VSSLRRILVGLLLLGSLAAWTSAAFADDAAHTTTPKHVAVHPVISSFASFDQNGMRFHYPEDYASLVVPLARQSTQTAARIVADLSPHVLDSVDIYFVYEMEDYFRAAGEKPRNPHWASGLALLGEDVILVKLSPNRGARLELDRTLAHELSHIALDHHVKGRALPHWFVEGFALLQTEEWNLGRANALAEAAVSDSLLPLWELDESFPAGAAKAQLAYAESGHFLRWLISWRGRVRFQQLTANLGQGMPFRPAFEKAYTESFDDIEHKWRTDLQVEDGWVAIIVASSTLFFAIGVLFVGIYLRVRHQREVAFAQIVPEPGPPVPEHLRDFGPFA